MEDNFLWKKKHGSNWVLDLDPQKMNLFLEVLDQCGKEISRSRLTWDPGELYRKVFVQAQIKHAPFFQYSIKIGRY